MSLPRILIADDEPTVRNFFKQWLVSKPLSIEIVDGGRKALELLGETSFDVAVLDLYMPDMDGLEVLQAVRKKGIQTDIVFMTAYSTKDGTLEKAVEAMKVGAVDFLSKPFELNEFLNLIYSLIERRQPSPHILAERLDGFLEKNAFSPSLRLDDLGQRFRISPSYATKLFRENNGTSFRKRLAYHRLQKAKRLLESTHDPLSSIAEECGFKNYHRLTEAFRRQEGMPPGKFRKISADEVFTNR